MNLTSASLIAAQLTGVIIALVIALLGAILAAVLFLNPSRKGRRKGWLKKLGEHMNFERFHMSAILKFLYAFTAIYCIVYGLITLFTGGGIAGLLWAVLGPVVSRVVFEQMLLLLSIREEAGETNDLLRRMQGLPPKNPIQTVMQPSQASAQTNRAAQPQSARNAQADPRYQQRQTGYPSQQGAGYGSYGNTSRQAPARPAEYGMTQRYAPIRNSGYGAGGYESANRPANGYDPASRPSSSYDAGSYTGATPIVRPTPADGTGRFSALPRREEPDDKTK